LKRFQLNCVTRRLLPSFAVFRLSSLGPIQLKGRKSVNLRPFWKPCAQMTRSSNCFDVL